MTNPTDPVSVVSQQFWGAKFNAPPPGAPPGAANDSYQIYEGATQAKNGFASWWVWDLRTGVFKLAWDLLRFKKIDDYKPAANEDRTVPWGMRDEISRIRYQADRALSIVEKIAAELKIDISGLP